MVPDKDSPATCPHCGQACQPADLQCPACGVDLKEAAKHAAAQDQAAARQGEGDSDVKEPVAGGSAVMEADGGDETPSTVPVEHEALIVCSGCGFACSPEDVTCPKCGTHLRRPDAAMLAAMQQAIITKPVEPHAIERFEPGTNAILQLVSSGGWLSLSLDEPMILGRGPSLTGEKTLDLTDFGGYEEGMSRRHCILRRSENRLKIADLGSANGTYLNEKQLIPHVDYTIRHGDQLVLGRLAITVLFSIIKLSDN